MRKIEKLAKSLGLVKELFMGKIIGLIIVIPLNRFGIRAVFSLEVVDAEGDIAFDLFVFGCQLRADKALSRRNISIPC